jgi:hypothetical protein
MPGGDGYGIGLAFDKIFHLLVQMMRINNDTAASGFYQPVNQGVEDRLVVYGKKRLGPHLGIRPQAGAKAGGQDQSFHGAIFGIQETV